MTEKYHKKKLEEAKNAEEAKTAELIRYNVDNGILSTIPEGPMRTLSRIQKGRYFSANGMTFLATTTIPAGDVINPGTNCERVSIDDILNN